MAQNRDRTVKRVRLSDLPRREALRRIGDELLRAGHSVAVIFLDLDGFKRVNDTLGHLAGDKCLQKIASIIQRVMGEDASLFRYGEGDEFVVLVELNDRAELRTRAEGIRSAIDAADVAVPLKVTASIGADCAQSGTTQRLLRRADEAAYASKIMGKNRTHICPLSRETRALVREHRAEEAFAAKHRTLLLEIVLLAEAVRQLAWHVGRLYPMWMAAGGSVWADEHALIERELKEVHGPFSQWESLEDPEKVFHTTRKKLFTRVRKLKIEEMAHRLTQYAIKVGEAREAARHYFVRSVHKWLHKKILLQVKTELATVLGGTRSRSTNLMQLQEDSVSLLRLLKKASQRPLSSGILELEIERISKRPQGIVSISERQRGILVISDSMRLWELMDKKEKVIKKAEEALGEYLDVIVEVEKTSERLVDVARFLLPEMRSLRTRMPS